MKNVMIDIETMSTEPDAAILSIGACVFDVDEYKITTEFYQNIDLTSCVHLGLRTETKTYEWWSKDENKQAWESLKSNKVDIMVGMRRFAEWCRMLNEDVVPWSNPSTFDIVILENAFGECQIPKPWKFYNVSCYRTFRRLFPTILTPRVGMLKHNALYDARYQAMHLMNVLRSIKLEEIQR